jgi:hypothetical protein
MFSISPLLGGAIIPKTGSTSEMKTFDEISKSLLNKNFKVVYELAVPSFGYI